MHRLGSEQTPDRRTAAGARRREERTAARDPLAGGGVCGERMRSIDWSRSPVGPVESWPMALRTTVTTLLHSRHPMFLWWGPELIQFYNDAYLPSFGVGKHPLAMGQPGADCWPEIWPIIHPQIRDVMERGISSWHENQLVPIFRNGQLEDVYWTYGYSPVFRDDGEIAGTLVVCTETTRAVLGRQEIERARQEAELARLRLDTLFQNSPAFVCALRGPDHIFEMANAPYRQLVGKERVLLGKRMREALPEVVGQGFTELLDDVYRRAEPFVGHETRVRLERRAGLLEDAFVTFVYQPRFDSSGQVDGIDVFGFEVTDEVRARTDAQNAAEANRILTAVIPQQVWTAAASGSLDYVNARVLEYFGRSESEMLGAGWQGVIHPDDLERCLSAWSRSIATGVDYEVEFRLRRADGAYRWHLGRAKALGTPGGGVARWFGTNTDIDDAKRAREELKGQHEFEQHLLGIVSHDLRNPLNTILLSAGLLARSEEVDERAAKSILRIQSSAERAGRMVNDLLDFTQARLGGGIPIQSTLTDLTTLARQVASEVEDVFPEREIRVEGLATSPGLWDPDRLSQIMTNLFTNALKYGAPGTPVTVRIGADNAGATLTVHNHGQAIPPGHLARLFEPMQRMSSRLNASDRSVGLGLYIVRSIVEAHRGQISVESSDADGTTFTVRLPGTPHGRSDRVD